MEKQTIKLAKEVKVFLLESIKQGYIDVNGFREVLGPDNPIAPVFPVTVIGTRVPLAYNEDDVLP